jgi:hypothetical protein
VLLGSFGAISPSAKGCMLHSNTPTAVAGEPSKIFRPSPLVCAPRVAIHAEMVTNPWQRSGLAGIYPYVYASRRLVEACEGAQQLHDLGRGFVSAIETIE